MITPSKIKNRNKIAIFVQIIAIRYFSKSCSPNLRLQYLSMWHYAAYLLLFIYYCISGSKQGKGWWSKQWREGNEMEKEK